MLNHTTLKVILFTKIPLNGFAKTRLSDEVGVEKAILLFKKLLDIHASNYKKLRKRHPDIIFEAHLAFPDNLSLKSAKKIFKSAFPFNCRLYSQSKGGLKTRMLQAMQKSEITDITVLHGSDVAGLNYSHFFTSFLQPEFVCISPSNDYGYGLISCPAGFLNNNFFPEHTAEDTLAALLKHLQKTGVPCRVIAPVFDIDTLTDYHLFKTNITQNSAKNQTILETLNL